MILKILRNIFALLTGYALSKVFALFCIIFVARRLGVEQFGTYGIVMAYLTLFSTFADSGLSTVTIREIAQDRERIDAHVSHVAVLRLVLTGGAYLLLLVVGGLWKKDEFSLLFIASSGLFLFPEGFRKLAISVFSAYERMDLVSLIEFCSTVVRYIPFLMVIALKQPLSQAFVLLVILWTGVAGIFLSIVKRWYLKQWFAPINFPECRKILSETVLFGIFSILYGIHFKADIIMLSKMQRKTAVGLYDAAYRFIDAAMVIPLTIINVLLPVMSRTFVADKDSYNTVYLHAVRILGIGMLPVAIVVSCFAQEIILLVYDTPYLASASGLAVLIWALFFIFLSAPLGNVIITTHQMRPYLPYEIANTLLNVLLNFLLIPHYSFVGAALATVVTKGLGFMVQLYFIGRFLPGTSSLLRMLGKLSILGIAAGGLLYAVRGYLMLPIAVLGFMGVYLGGLFALKLIVPEDQQLYRALMERVFHRRSA